MSVSYNVTYVGEVQQLVDREIKKIKEITTGQASQEISAKYKYGVNTIDHNNTMTWIETLIQTPISDHRKSLYLENSLTISIECKKSIIRRIVFCNKGLVGINYLVLGDKLAFQGFLSVSS